MSGCPGLINNEGDALFQDPCLEKQFFSNAVIFSRTHTYIMSTCRYVQTFELAARTGGSVPTASDRIVHGRTYRNVVAVVGNKLTYLHAADKGTKNRKRYGNGENVFSSSVVCGIRLRRAR